MTKQEEIREELIKFFTPPNTTFNGNPILEGNITGVVDELLRLEGKLGVVIKVDGEWPSLSEYDNRPTTNKTVDFQNGFIVGKLAMQKAGYVAVEPLIKEK